MTLLSPVQIEALRRSFGHKGFGYFLDMGLGKTMLALEEFHRAIKRRLVTRMVVLCPNSFKSGWLAEVEKHDYTYDVHVFEASKIKAAKQWMGKRFNRPPVLVVNYEAIRLDKTLTLIEEFTQDKEAMLVIDESIALKNPTAKRTRSILGIAPLFAMVRLLTGKPQTQGPHDLWAQLKLAGNKDNRNFYAFRNRFCRMGGWQGREVIGSTNEDELRRLMDPITFIARKDDWLEGMPEKTYTIRNYELGPILGQQYREMEQVYMTWLREQGRTVTVEIAITKYIKLAQIQCGFIIDEGGQLVQLVPDKDNPRLNLLKEVLEETTGKVAVCFRHRYVGEQLFRELLDYDPAILRGGMMPGEIAMVKARFNASPMCRVILLQIQASKFGHTLIGDQSDIANACSAMVFYENSYSLDDRSQIEDRIHRIGQGFNCLYVDLVGTPLDGEVIAALQRKQGMYEAVMGRR